MGWRLEPEPTMSSLEGSLIRKIAAPNLLGTAALVCRIHPGNAHTQDHSGIMLWRLLCLNFFHIIDCLLSFWAMCLKFVGMLGIAMRTSHPSMFVSWECVWEYPTRHEQTLCTVSNTKKKSPLKDCKDMPVFLLVGKRNDKMQRKNKKERGEWKRVQRFQCGVLGVQICNKTS